MAGKKLTLADVYRDIEFERDTARSNAGRYTGTVNDRIEWAARAETYQYCLDRLHNYILENAR